MADDLSADEIIRLLRLAPHPEGGFYRETYASAESVAPVALPARYGGPRSFGTAIYYLLTPDTFSALHRVQTDELYHFYLGDPVELLQLLPDGAGRLVTLGANLRAGMLPQALVPRGAWQGSRLRAGGRYALLGTTVAPGFDFADFEFGDRAGLSAAYPDVRSHHRSDAGVNAVDIAILAVVGLSAVLGLRRGFVAGVLDLAGVVVAVALAARYYGRLTGPLTRLGLDRPLAATIAFAGLNLAAVIVAGVIIGLLVRPLLRRSWPPPLRVLDGLLGLIPGAMKGLALAALVLVPLAFLQQPASLSREIRASRYGEPLVSAGLDALYYAADRLNLNLADFATVTQRSEEGTIELPFKVTSGLTTDAAAEEQMLALLNADRAHAGLAPLQLDPALRDVARAHSEEMFELGYFSHVSPVHGDPAQRLAAAGIQYLVAGENLAYAPSVAAAHEGLMASPPHRANILNPSFTRVGIGVIRSPNRGIMVTQDFAG